MKKSDLKTGMVVETENGEKYLVMLEPDCEGRELINFSGGYMSLSSYNDELMLEKSYEEFDIMKVYSVGGSIRWLLRDKELMNFKLIWQRKEIKEIKEMTVKEIEKELGYKIKIVGDENVK